MTSSIAAALRKRIFVLRKRAKFADGNGLIVAFVLDGFQFVCQILSEAGAAHGVGAHSFILDALLEGYENGFAAGLETVRLSRTLGRLVPVAI